MFRQQSILDYCSKDDKILDYDKIETCRKYEEKEHSEYLKLQKEETR